MKMLVLTYTGENPERISTMLDQLSVPGHTRIDGATGHGLTGPRQASRAFPGQVTICFSVVDDELAAAVARHCQTAELSLGERLHMAVLPVESFS